MICVNSLIGISDLHVGCVVGLCPPTGAVMDGGGRYVPSPLQGKMWALWRDVWDNWVPMATQGDDYGVVFNGDAIDGRHHGTTTQWSHNLADQVAVAYEILAPIVELCGGRFWMIRGTECHGGQSGEDEERLAERLGAIPNAEGQYARFELWKWVGDNEDILTHWLHHIGTTGSSAYETTALHRELVEAFTEAGRWGRRPPDFIVRSHRHRFAKTEVPTLRERAVSMTTPAWQGKTPLTYRIAGGRQSQPQFGALMVRLSEEGEPYERHRVYSLDRPEAE